MENNGIIKIEEGDSYLFVIARKVLIVSVLFFVSGFGYGLNINPVIAIHQLQKDTYSKVIDRIGYGTKDHSKKNIQHKNSKHVDLSTVFKTNHNSKASCLNSLSSEVSGEKGLAIESWMLESRFFEPVNNDSKVDLDQPMKIEEWMVNCRLFGYSLETVQKEELKIELWMIRDSLWGY